MSKSGTALSSAETMIAALPEPILAWGMNETVLEARGIGWDFHVSPEVDAGGPLA